MEGDLARGFIIRVAVKEQLLATCLLARRLGGGGITHNIGKQPDGHTDKDGHQGSHADGERAVLLSRLHMGRRNQRGKNGSHEDGRNRA